MLRNLFQQKIAHEGDVYWEEYRNRPWFDAVVGAVFIGAVICILGLIGTVADKIIP